MIQLPSNSSFPLLSTGVDPLNSSIRAIWNVEDKLLQGSDSVTLSGTEGKDSFVLSGQNFLGELSIDGGGGEKDRLIIKSWQIFEGAELQFVSETSFRLESADATIDFSQIYSITVPYLWGWQGSRFISFNLETEEGVERFIQYLINVGISKITLPSGEVVYEEEIIVEEPSTEEPDEDEDLFPEDPEEEAQEIEPVYVYDSELQSGTSLYFEQSYYIGSLEPVYQDASELDYGDWTSTFSEYGTALSRLNYLSRIAGSLTWSSIANGSWNSDWGGVSNYYGGYGYSGLGSSYYGNGWGGVSNYYGGYGYSGLGSSYYGNGNYYGSSWNNGWGGIQSIPFDDYYYY